MRKTTVNEFAEEIRLDTHSQVLSVEPAGYPPSLESSRSHRLISAGSSFSLRQEMKRIRLCTATYWPDHIDCQTQPKNYITLLSCAVE